MHCVVLFGSLRLKGNTNGMLDLFLQSLQPDSVDRIDICSINLNACIGCMQCNQTPACSLPDWDKVKEIYQRIQKADVFVLASPVYFLSAPSMLKAFIDRLQPYYAQRFINNACKQEKKIPLRIANSGCYVSPML